MSAARQATPVIFDSDGGIDDAAALWQVCASPQFDLLAVTATGGNVAIDQAARNLLTVLAAAGRSDVPVALGRPKPLGPCPAIVVPTAIHGHDGMGDLGLERADISPIAESAVDVLVDRVRRQPGEVTVIAVGPLTNIADAIHADRDWSAAVRRLVFMGGSARRGGNVSPLAEANIAGDPLAADHVLAANWAEPPLMIGLDVTLKATMGDSDFAVLHERRTAAAEFLAGPLDYYRVHGSRLSDDGGCPCHDLLAVLAAADPSLVETRQLPVSVDLGQSSAWGTTVVDMRGLSPTQLPDGSPPPGLVEVALDVDVARFRSAVLSLLTVTRAEKTA